MILLIMGPQGSGKGTQARRLAAEFGLFYFDAGAALRKIAKTDPRISEIVNKRGALLPDEEMFKIVTGFLEEKGVYDNLLLDGYPRSLVQFNLINQWISAHGGEIAKAIFITIDEAESVKRLSARRIDKTTGKIYNLLTKLPGPEVDPENLIHREDDQPEAVVERLRLYHATTEPLVNLLRERGMLIEVNGQRPVEEIHNEIKEKIKGIQREEI